MIENDILNHRGLISRKIRDSKLSVELTEIAKPLGVKISVHSFKNEEVGTSI